MPHTFTWESDSVYIHFSGVLASEELMTANSELVGNPAFDEINYLIWDGTDIAAIELDSNDADVSSSFAEETFPYNRFIKVAFITTDKDLHALISLYVALTLKKVPDAQQQIFSNKVDALDWARN